MNEDDIVKMINEEQARVTARKKDIETKVHAKNMEYDELIANKDAVAEEAKKILQQEGEIREDEKIVQALATTCNDLQTKLVEINNKLSSGSVKDADEVTKLTEDFKKM